MRILYSVNGVQIDFDTKNKFMAFRLTHPVDVPCRATVAWRRGVNCRVMAFLMIQDIVSSRQSHSYIYSGNSKNIQGKRDLGLTLVTSKSCQNILIKQEYVIP